MEALPSRPVSRTVATEPFSGVPASKLVHPTPAGHTIARQRLLPNATVAQEMQIGVVVAPAGYGASTAATQIANHLDPQHFWLNIERSDNDPERMLWHLAAALKLDQRATRALQQTLNKGVRVAVDLLRAEVERHSGPTLLVLDGLHNLTNADLVSALAEWVDAPPPNLRMLYTSRGEPNLPLERVRARGRLFELRADELALTRAEATEVQNRIEGKEGADASIVDELWERTVGWPTAFYLTALDHGPKAAPVPPSLGRYLETEILTHLPTRARRFLLETSVLDVLPPDLCTVLTGDPDARAMLNWLTHNHVLTTRTESPESTFRYHPLLRHYLRHELLSLDTKRHNALANRAADWYKDRGDLVSAMAYATSAGNVAMGKGLVAESWRSVAEPVIFESVQDWAAAMGPDATSDGIVCTILAWGALVHGDTTSMRSWIERARIYTTKETAATVIVSTELILAHWHCMRGELEKMRTRVELATSAASDAERDEQSPGLMPALKVAVTSTTGICELMSGDIERACKLLRAVNLPVRKPHQEQTLLDVLNYLALGEALLGNIDQALVHADEAILRKKRRPHTFPSCSMAHLTQSIAYLAKEDWERAANALQLSKEALQSQVGPVQRGLIHLQDARLHHFRGQLDEAHRALRNASEIERETPHSLLGIQIRSTTNELRFLGHGTNDQLPPGARKLTRREVEVMRGLKSHASRREVARQLHISENTLKTHMTSISRKLDASGRQAIVDRADDLGLLN